MHSRKRNACTMGSPVKMGMSCVRSSAFSFFTRAFLPFLTGRHSHSFTFLLSPLLIESAMPRRLNHSVAVAATAFRERKAETHERGGEIGYCS